MIKLKNILSEAYAWERQEGKPLPTLKDVQTAYRKNLQENEDEINLDIADTLIQFAYADSEEQALRALDKSSDYDTIVGVYKSGHMTQREKAQTIADMLDFEDTEVTRMRNDITRDDEDMDYSEDFMEEAYDAKGVEDAVDEAEGGAKPDYIDLDKDGNEEESMKQAALDAKDDSKEVNEEETEDESDEAVDDAAADTDALNMGSLEESTFWGRVKGNLHGHEYILREAFRK
jgi:hypothetical protein